MQVAIYVKRRVGRQRRMATTREAYHLSVIDIQMLKCMIEAQQQNAHYQIPMA